MCRLIHTAQKCSWGNKQTDDKEFKQVNQQQTLDWWKPNPLDLAVHLMRPKANLCINFLLILSYEGYEQNWPDLFKLFTRSKQGADLPLTRAFFDQTLWGFIIRKEKIEIIGENFPDPRGTSKITTKRFKPEKIITYQKENFYKILSLCCSNMNMKKFKLLRNKVAFCLTSNVKVCSGIWQTIFWRKMHLRNVMLVILKQILQTFFHFFLFCFPSLTIHILSLQQTLLTRIIFKLANQASALPGKNFMSLRHPFGHFTLHKVFSPVIRLGFGVWGTLGSRVRVGGIMLLLRTFPELVGRSVQNLVDIGLAVRAWKGDIGRYIVTNSHFYIYR